MANDWPDWLPDNLKVEPCVLYSVRQVSADTFTFAFADPLGSTIWSDVARDEIIHDLLMLYSAPPLPKAQMKRGYVVRTARVRPR